MRIAAPAFVYALTLLKLVVEPAPKVQQEEVQEV